MLLQACLNGGLRGSAVPQTPEDLATDAAAVAEAGAGGLHLHPRGPDGAESLAPVDVAAAVMAVRAAAPGLPVGVGTGFWIGGAARIGQIAAWTVRSDYASVNLNEADAPVVMATLAAAGIGIEAGLWRLADADRLVELAEADALPARPLRLLVEMTDDDPAEADRVLALLAALPGLPILLHGEGGSAWPILARAVAGGHDTRIGFEDVQVLPDGGAAPDNAALVRAAVGIARAHGRLA